jgi:hypothetical protein
VETGTPQGDWVITMYAGAGGGEGGSSFDYGQEVAGYRVSLLTPASVAITFSPTGGPLGPLPNLPETPYTLLLPLAALGVIGGAVWLRRRRRAVV